MAGASFPLTFPIVFGSVAPSGVTVTNEGNAVVWPVFTISGPCTDPVVVNGTDPTSPELLFANPDQTSYTILDGDQLVITTQPGARSCLYYSGGAESGSTGQPVMSWLQPASVWFPLQPGDTLVQFRSSDAAPTGATLAVSWSSAYVL